MSINPIKLSGNWTEGYVMDIHTISSEMIGEDVYGHPQFESVRSDLGELLFQFKYRNKYKNLDVILETIKPFLDNWDGLKSIDAVISVPSSKPRLYQPAEEIAAAISEYIGKRYDNDVIKKADSFQSKDLSGNKDALEGSFSLVKHAIREHNILIVDDLYSTGRVSR